jgi:biopolymer transport protein TolQ
MTTEPSILSFVFNASPIVKVVIVLLIMASIVSWTIIFQRWSFFTITTRAAKKFEEQFWGGGDLANLYQNLSDRGKELRGLAHIFHSGFGEYMRLSKQTSATPDSIMEGAERAMRAALARETACLEQHLSFLSTVGSTSPYVGLFGTVWGIMTSFRALGVVQQATIAMVAPGISEALIATAMGLFAAIPAVIAYNRYATDAERLANDYDTFIEEFSNILHRQAHGKMGMPHA